ncbi:hypothetical protein PRIPAC_75720 [Pristionchus pacificus]|nr:hypothetical protein PRIPAC_75720 [Pristionchus pacificus]
MSDTQWRRVVEIESYKQKTFNLSRTDRIGRVITKTFDLIQTIVRDGPHSETFIYDVESLKTEQANAMKWDPNHSDLFRSILYDLSSSVGSMIESIQVDNLPENYFQGTFTDKTVESNEEDASTYQIFMSDTVKVEPAEFHDDRPFTKVDMKPICPQNSVEEDVIMDRTDVVNTDINTKDDSTAHNAPEIRQSMRKRPRSVIIPKVDYEEEDNEENTDKDPVTPCTPTTPGAGNFNCNHCERWFNSSLGLKRHMLIHEGTRCSDCGKRLKTRDNLQRHYTDFHPGKPVKAANELPFAFASLKCTQCEHTASDYSNLIIHARKHSGKKPWERRVDISSAVSTTVHEEKRPTRNTKKEHDRKKNK